jgi:hypothetical protein
MDAVTLSRLLYRTGQAIRKTDWPTTREAEAAEQAIEALAVLRASGLERVVDYAGVVEYGLGAAVMLRMRSGAQSLRVLAAGMHLPSRDILMALTDLERQGRVDRIRTDDGKRHRLWSLTGAWAKPSEGGERQ